VPIAVPAAGTFDVPVIRATQEEPPEGTLAVPPEGDMTLDVLAVGPDDIVGAAAGAVEIVGPAGQSRTLDGEPGLLAAEEMGGREMLVGRPALPRQMAVFRFDDVPRARLRAGDTPVEIGFTLDAFSPATVQSAAEATFVAADGRSRSFTFTPEGHHPTLLFLDRDFWDGGPLEVRLECLTQEDYMGLVPGSVRLRLRGDPYPVHFAKGVLSVLLFGTILVAAAVFVTTRLSWYVSILATATVLAVGTVGRIFFSYSAVGEAGGWLSTHIREAPGGEWLLAHLQLHGFLPGGAFSTGAIVPWWDVAASVGLVAVVTALLVAAGARLLKTREVAA
jgi:hypothetical protein